MLPAHGAASVSQVDARTSIEEASAPLICTDPPYYDNIGYADLSDFFYVCLRRSLKGIYPDLFRTIVTPKTAELVAIPYRFDGNRRSADRFFEQGLRASFQHLQEIADSRFPVTLFYAFKQAESARDGSVVSTGGRRCCRG
jgi:putative DNA methylase